MSKSFMMNLDGVSAASTRQNVAPGTYRAKITSVVIEEDTKYGNAARFNLQIDEPEDEHHNYRTDTLLWIPDADMAEKTAEVAKKERKGDDWAENFMGLMASKWVSLIQACGYKAGGNMDARKVAKKLVGSELLIIVQKRRNSKPGDDYTDVNGYEPVPDNYSGGGSDDSKMDVAAAADDGDDDGEDFDLDEI